MRTLAPSHANAWIHCPAFEPEPRISDTDAAREGSAAAWIADTVLKSHEGIDAEDFLGETAPNGWEITPDMIRYVSEYISYIVCESGGRGFQTEKLLSAADLGIVGRIDTLLAVDAHTVHIVDFKYGWRIVEPWDNWQFICYGWLAMTGETKRFIFTVYQPRPNHPDGPIRTIEYDRTDFMRMAADMVTGAIRCQNEPNTAVPGSACVNCLKRSSCPALSANVYAGLETITTDIRSRELTPVELSRELEFTERLLKMVQDRHTGLQTEVDARISNGEFIPDRYRVPQESNSYINVSPEIVRLFTGCDPFKKVHKTITDLRKEGVTNEVIKAITTTRINGMKTVKHNRKKTERLFKNVKR